MVWNIVLLECFLDQLFIILFVSENLLNKTNKMIKLYNMAPGEPLLGEINSSIP